MKIDKGDICFNCDFEIEGVTCMRTDFLSIKPLMFCLPCSKLWDGL